MKASKEIKIEGYTGDEVLSFSDVELNEFVFIGEPLVFTVGSAQVLGEFRIENDALIIELAQIEGGGEGVLHFLWSISKQYAKKRCLRQIEWIVHAVNCAKPNLKLKRVLEKRGFVIKNINGIGDAFYYNLTLDFLGKKLVIPEKSDIERDAVVKEWEEHGGEIIRLGRFWEPPELKNDEICLYGNHVFCMILAQKLDLELISPSEELLVNISEKWLKRTVRKNTLAKAVDFRYPCFIKPLTPKIFTARRYNSYAELCEECRQLDNSTPIIFSDIIEIAFEARSFILNGHVMAIAVYEGKSNVEEAKSFIEDFIKENSVHLPSTCVIDVGYVDGIGWVVIEANATWGAGLNGCDPYAVAICLANATKSLASNIIKVPEEHSMIEKSQKRIMEIVPYNPEWKDQFIDEANRIKDVFKNEIICIHHIGCTSIPGIYAKPIIDILVEVRDIDVIDQYNDSMEQLGYIARGEFGLPGRRYFIKGLYNRTHHVHMYQKENSEIARHLNFRDYMISHPKDARKYEDLKKELANKFRYDPASYNDGKDAFIKEIDRKAENIKAEIKGYIGTWCIYPWYYEFGENLIHPLDLNRFKERFQNSGGRIFFCENYTEGYLVLKYKSEYFKVKPDLYKRVSMPTFFYGDFVKLKDRPDSICFIEDIIHNKGQPKYKLNVDGRLKSKWFFENEIDSGIGGLS